MVLKILYSTDFDDVCIRLNTHPDTQLVLRKCWKVGGFFCCLLSSSSVCIFFAVLSTTMRATLSPRKEVLGPGKTALLYSRAASFVAFFTFWRPESCQTKEWSTFQIYRRVRKRVTGHTYAGWPAQGEKCVLFFSNIDTKASFSNREKHSCHWPQEWQVKLSFSFQLNSTPDKELLNWELKGGDCIQYGSFMELARAWKEATSIEMCWDILNYACVLIQIYWITQLLSHICLFVTPRTVACRAPLSMGFSKQEYRSQLWFPPPGNLPNSGIKSKSPVLAGGFFSTEPKLQRLAIKKQNLMQWEIS